MNTEAPLVRSTQRHLTVSVAGRIYAIAGDLIVEVLRRPTATRVPNGPHVLVGVSNLRGVVVPVVSLAKLLDQEPGAEERLVVLDDNGPVGVLVDAVLRLDDVGDISKGQQIDIVNLLRASFSRTISQTPSRHALTKASQDKVETPIAHRVLLTLTVARQIFALPLDSVVEVLRMPGEISRLAGADDAVFGVAEVRNRTLPLISLGTLLGFGANQPGNGESRILVVDHAGSRIGLLVDGIESILRLSETAIDSVPPILQRSAGSAELDAIGRPGGGRPLISILSVPRLFANEAVEATLAATEERAAIMTNVEAPQAQEQFVVFELGPEQYGLPIKAVQEVLRLPEVVTRLPNGPRFVRGIINLRGRPVPIIDQRQRFDAPPSDGSVQPRVVVVSFGDLQAGLVVDAVSEIASLSSSQIASAPAFSSDNSAVFNRVAHLGEEGGLILLIDPAELLSRAEQDLLAEIAAKQSSAATA